MKRSIAVLALGFVVAVLCSGCYVASLAPFYSDDSVVFEPALVGTWKGEPDETWSFKRASDPPGTYEGELTEPAWGGDRDAPKATSPFTVRVFRLGKALFFDAFPTRSEPHPGTKDKIAANRPIFPGPSWHELRTGTHFLARFRVEGDQLRVAVMDPEKLDAALHAKGAVPLAHLHLADGIVHARPGGPAFANLLLTAATGEVQSFLRTHETDGTLYEDETVFHRIAAR